MKKIAKKPKRIGRPPLPDGQRRDRWLDFVRFSAAELDQIKQSAAKAGATPTAWVRSRLGV